MPLTYSEIESWSRLMGVSLTPHDVQALTAMDEAHCSEMTETIAYHNRRRDAEAKRND